MGEAKTVELLGGPRDGVQLVIGQESGVPEVQAPEQLVLPRVEPSIQPGLSSTLAILAAWASGEPCPFRLMLDLYRLSCDDETGQIAYIYAGQKSWPLERWREVPGVHWQTMSDPGWGM